MGERESGLRHGAFVERYVYRKDEQVECHVGSIARRRNSIESKVTHAAPNVERIDQEEHGELNGPETDRKRRIFLSQLDSLGRTDENQSDDTENETEVLLD